MHQTEEPEKTKPEGLTKGPFLFCVAQLRMDSYAPVASVPAMSSRNTTRSEFMKMDEVRLALIIWALQYHTLILFLNGTIMKYKFMLFLPGC